MMFVPDINNSIRMEAVSICYFSTEGELHSLIFQLPLEACLAFCCLNLMLLVSLLKL